MISDIFGKETKTSNIACWVISNFKTKNHFVVGGLRAFLKSNLLENFQNTEWGAFGEIENYRKKSQSAEKLERDPSDYSFFVCYVIN